MRPGTREYNIQYKYTFEPTRYCCSRAHLRAAVLSGVYWWFVFKIHNTPTLVDEDIRVAAADIAPTTMDSTGCSGDDNKTKEKDNEHRAMR